MPRAHLSEGKGEGLLQFDEVDCLLMCGISESESVQSHQFIPCLQGEGRGGRTGEGRGERKGKGGGEWGGGGRRGEGKGGGRGRGK